MEDLPDPGVEPGSPALKVDSLPTDLSGKPNSHVREVFSYYLFNIFSGPLFFFWDHQKVNVGEFNVVPEVS